jgi:predicted RNA-binding Zn ribbon-like protein
MTGFTMSWHTIDGGVVPDDLAGPLALDFCNTRAAWNADGPPPRDVDPAGVITWAVEHDLLDAKATAAVPAPAELRRVLTLRRALYRCLGGHGEGGDWAAITTEARRARQAGVLGPDPATGAVGWSLPPAGIERVLALVTEDALGLLTAHPAGVAHACPGPHCGWLFVDPRGRRRWCSMALCGNRVKARRHAARQHG